MDNPTPSISSGEWGVHSITATEMVKRAVTEQNWAKASFGTVGEMAKRTMTGPERAHAPSGTVGRAWKQPREAVAATGK